MSKYFWNVFVGFDQFVNAVLGGDPDETISSRIGKWNRSSCRACKIVSVPVCWFLGLFDSKHCVEAIEEDEGGDALV